RPLRRAAAVHRARARVPGDQPADALRAPAHAGARRDRRPRELPRVPAPGRVPADQQGRRPPPAQRGDAYLWPRLADRRARPRARRPASPRRRPLLSEPDASALLEEAHGLDVQALDAEEASDRGRELRAQAAALRVGALGPRVYPVLTCTSCFHLTG